MRPPAMPPPLVRVDGTIVGAALRRRTWYVLYGAAQHDDDDDDGFELGDYGFVIDGRLTYVRVQWTPGCRLKHA
jgi:hypothetical protein